MSDLSKMQEAVNWLIEAIDNGVEFSDAAHYAATKFEVNQINLEAEFDSVFDGCKHKWISLDETHSECKICGKIEGE